MIEIPGINSGRYRIDPCNIGKKNSEIMKKFNYDTTLTCTEDLELWTRLAMENQKMEILPECLLIYRLHDKQITSTTLERQHTEVINILQKSH